MRRLRAEGGEVRVPVDGRRETRELVDSLNVFPVPDSDTGTNVLLTLRSAADALALLPEGFAMEVVMRMLRMEAVQKEALDGVERTLRTDFMANLARAKGRDAHEAMAEIFNNLDRHAEARLLAALEERNREAAERIGGFYSAGEYDIAPLLAYPGRILELGRSCVHEAYRTRGTLQLLWRGIAAYVFLHRIDLMFGCASLCGTDPDALAQELTYLHRDHLAPPELRPRALPGRYVEMRRLDPATVDARRALAALPPLVKGYLRLGGFVGDGAVLDTQFNTTDVCVVVKTDLVTDKYYRHYERKLGGPEAGE